MATLEDTPTFVNLNVGEQHFCTTIFTLCEGKGDGSRLFSGLFNSPEGKEWLRRTSMVGMRPRYDLDLDAEVFRHVLSYLRSGVMPLLWSENKGFDYNTYAQLEKMAEFLRIERLRDWVAGQEYLRAVTCQYRVDREIVRGDDLCEINEVGVEEPRGLRSWRVRVGANVKCEIHPADNDGWMGMPGEDMAFMTVRKELKVDNEVLFDEEGVSNGMVDGPYRLNILFGYGEDY